MQPTKVYKFAAATVMTTVAAATAITFTSADQAGSSPVAAVLPRVPAAGGAAPSVGINDEPATPSPTPTSATTIQPPATQSPDSTTSSRSSDRPKSEPAKNPKAKPEPRSPSPLPSPSQSRSNPLGDLLDSLLG